MARWEVLIEGTGLQGGGDTLADAAGRAADAHRREETWEARIHDGISWRLLTDNEAATLVAAIAKELS